MYAIQDAKIRRLTEVDGLSCAEVEVQPGNAGDPLLLVYVASTQPGNSLEVVRIVRNHSDSAIDWYNNNMHTAFEEATEAAFENSEGMTVEEDKARFQSELFSFGLLGPTLQRYLIGQA
ncbi:hypothetical protein IFU39_29285 [Paenibacillus sp. CFBP 13594]|uniref:hypothetical protein n=1 Tax=Paenibacillus sp. CFBP 13594 TaxID=2774037 RepID=UPI001780B4C3|nr:hypothetical protein [Paenibacillus sp. CFBP 13594]MBD8841883.1 hypothetical protein [Paenibacillus sp. CFBP 13594]